MNKNNKLAIRINRPIDIIFRILILLYIVYEIIGMVFNIYISPSGIWVWIFGGWPWLFPLNVIICYMLYRFIFKGIFNNKSLIKWPVYIYRLFGIITGFFIGLFIDEIISNYVFYQYFAPAATNHNMYNFEFIGYGFSILINSVFIFVYFIGIELSDFVYLKIRNKELTDSPDKTKKMKIIRLITYIIVAVTISAASIIATNTSRKETAFPTPPAEYCNKGYTSEYAKQQCEESKITDQ